MTNLPANNIHPKSNRKYHANNVYLPGISYKTNFNFPLNKSLFTKEKSDQQNIAEGNRQMNPQQKSMQKQQINRINRSYFSEQKFKKFSKEINQRNIRPPQLHGIEKINFRNNQLAQKSTESDLNKLSAEKQKKNNYLFNKKNQQLNMNKSAIYFTKRKAEQLENTLSQFRNKNIQRMNKYLEKRQQFQDFKKRKQLLKQQEKCDFFENLHFQKLQRDRELIIQKQTKKQENNFLHDCSLDKVQMLRHLHQTTKYQDIAFVKDKYLETQHQSHFSKMEKLKAKRDHDRLLESRLVFLLDEKIGQDQERFLDKRMTSRKLQNSRKWVEQPSQDQNRELYGQSNQLSRIQDSKNLLDDQEQKQSDVKKEEIL